MLGLKFDCRNMRQPQLIVWSNRRFKCQQVLIVVFVGAILLTESFVTFFSVKLKYN